MTTDDAPRPALDAAALERLREGYSPEPPPLPCHAPADLEQRGTDDAGWRCWYCRVCGFVRMTAPGDPDVLALLRAYAAAAARADALAGEVARLREEVAILCDEDHRKLLEIERLREALERLRDFDAASVTSAIGPLHAAGLHQAYADVAAFASAALAPAAGEGGDGK